MTGDGETDLDHDVGALLYRHACDVDGGLEGEDEEMDEDEEHARRFIHRRDIFLQIAPKSGSPIRHQSQSEPNTVSYLRDCTVRNYIFR